MGVEVGKRQIGLVYYYMPYANLDHHHVVQLPSCMSALYIASWWPSIYLYILYLTNISITLVIDRTRKSSFLFARSDAAAAAAAVHRLDLACSSRKHCVICNENDLNLPGFLKRLQHPTSPHTINLSQHFQLFVRRL